MHARPDGEQRAAERVADLEVALAPSDLADVAPRGRRVVAERVVEPLGDLVRRHTRVLNVVEALVGGELGHAVCLVPPLRLNELWKPRMPQLDAASSGTSRCSTTRRSAKSVGFTLLPSCGKICVRIVLSRLLMVTFPSRPHASATDGPFTLIVIFGRTVVLNFTLFVCPGSPGPVKLKYSERRNSSVHCRVPSPLLVGKALKITELTSRFSAVPPPAQDGDVAVGSSVTPSLK